MHDSGGRIKGFTEMSPDELFSQLRTAYKVEAKKKYEWDLAAIESKVIEKQLELTVKSPIANSKPKRQPKTELDKFKEKHAEQLTSDDLLLLEKKERTPLEIEQIYGDNYVSAYEVRLRLNGKSKTGIAYRPGRSDRGPGKRRYICSMSVVEAIINGVSEKE